MLLDSFGFILIFIVAMLLSIPLGAYMKKVYNSEKSLLEFLQPVEKKIFRICRIDPEKPMNWKQYLLSLLFIQIIWVLTAFILLIFQGRLFLNPDHIQGMEWTLAWNTAVSFLTSTNLQHYSGETGASNLSQIGVFTFLQFVSAATSLSAGVAIVRGLTKDPNPGIFNFYVLRYAHDF
jgi:K+-transporting ATPase ATPase A chain